MTRYELFVLGLGISLLGTLLGSIAIRKTPLVEGRRVRIWARYAVALFAAVGLSLMMPALWIPDPCSDIPDWFWWALGCWLP